MPHLTACEVKYTLSVYLRLDEVMLCDISQEGEGRAEEHPGKPHHREY